MLQVVTFVHTLIVRSPRFIFELVLVCAPYLVVNKGLLPRTHHSIITYLIVSLSLQALGSAAQIVMSHYVGAEHHPQVL